MGRQKDREFSNGQNLSECCTDIDRGRDQQVCAHSSRKEAINEETREWATCRDKWASMIPVYQEIHNEQANLKYFMGRSLSAYTLPTNANILFNSTSKKNTELIVIAMSHRGLSITILTGAR